MILDDLPTGENNIEALADEVRATTTKDDLHAKVCSLLRAKVLGMVAERKEIIGVLTQLLGPSGSEITLEPASDFVEHAAHGRAKADGGGYLTHVLTELFEPLWGHEWGRRRRS